MPSKRLLEHAAGVAMAAVRRANDAFLERAVEEGYSAEVSRAFWHPGFEQIQLSVIDTIQEVPRE
jgi:hypothetical protein